MVRMCIGLVAVLLGIPAVAAADTGHFQGRTTVGSGEAVGVGLPPEGGLVVGGWDTGEWRQFTHYRTGFASPRRTSFGYYLNATALSMFVEPDGKLVMAGYMPRTEGRFSIGIVARFLVVGSLDPSFGEGGLVRLQFHEHETSEYVFAIARDPVGRILFIHSWGGPSIGRLLPDGRLDTGFGRLVFGRNAPGGVISLTSLAAMPDGGAVAGGQTDDEAAVVRVTARGERDPAWGQGGIARYSGGGAGAVAPAPGGGVALGGTSMANGHDSTFWAARMDATGRLDPSFGSASGVATPLGTGSQSTGLSAHVRSVAVQADGKILIAGSARFNHPGQWVRRGAIIRHRTDGTLDPSFGDGGVAWVPDEHETSEINAIALGRDQVVAVGEPEMTVMRFSNDGEPYIPGVTAPPVPVPQPAPAPVVVTRPQIEIVAPRSQRLARGRRVTVMVTVPRTLRRVTVELRRAGTVVARQRRSKLVAGRRTPIRLTLRRSVRLRDVTIRVRGRDRGGHPRRYTVHAAR